MLMYESVCFCMVHDSVSLTPCPQGHQASWHHMTHHKRCKCCEYTFSAEPTMFVGQLALIHTDGDCGTV